MWTESKLKQHESMKRRSIINVKTATMLGLDESMLRLQEVFFCGHISCLYISVLSLSI